MKLKKYALLAVSAITLFACTGKQTSQNSKLSDNDMYLLVGTYTSGESEGIYVYTLDTVTGDSKLVSSTKVTDPSYLAITDDNDFVYAVTESNTENDAANAFAFDRKKGELVFLNSQLTNGAAPCYISVDPTGKNVITANYMGGSISSFKTDENGALLPNEGVIKFEGKSIDKARQDQPHLHCVKYTPDNKFLFANDLGSDKIYKFDVISNDSKKSIKLSSPASFDVKLGSGPRHTVFHPEYKYAYMVTEISGDVIAYHYDEGNLEEFQTIKIDSLKAEGAGDIQISADGKFLYASNRLKGDGLAILSINQKDGTLTPVGYQKTGIHPRNFLITPNDKYVLVACKDSKQVQIFERNKETGLLTDIKKDIVIDMPVCLKMAPMK